MRGNLHRRHLMDTGVRSIPACAGEPSEGSSRCPSRKVYPRVCGGTRFPTAVGIDGEGLSPRVRGNHWPTILARQHMRSIPACAGEPAAPASRHPCWPVYPRVCGGTISIVQSRPAQKGLSPRVRGNRRRDAGEIVGVGSIPACAGEPAAPASRHPCWPVYPRVCGGTISIVQSRPAQKGLSPRVRGNRRRDAGEIVGVGSIPACAGEPLGASRRSSRSMVYPRVCGGTGRGGLTAGRGGGLSPRVRGNQLRTHPSWGRVRSIPACAGEPPPPALPAG